MNDAGFGLAWILFFCALPVVTFVVMTAGKLYDLLKKRRKHL